MTKNRCNPRVQELLERWKNLDREYSETQKEWRRAFDLAADAKQRLYEIKSQQRCCVLEILRFLDMTD